MSGKNAQNDKFVCRNVGAIADGRCGKVRVCGGKMPPEKFFSSNVVAIRDGRGENARTAGGSMTLIRHVVRIAIVVRGGGQPFVCLGCVRPC